jgi:ATP-dependent DNA helicase RecG
LSEDPAVRVFSRLVRDARAWVKAPEGPALLALVEKATAATAGVPEERRADWSKLLAGFAAEEAEAKRRARVQGLLRACQLFDREQRAAERLSIPLGWTDPVERADGVGPTGRERLATHGVGFVADLVWTLPVGWDDLRTPVRVEDAIERTRAAEAAFLPPPRQVVRAVVKSASLVPMRGRRAVRLVAIDEGGKTALDAWWFYAAHGVLAAARAGTTCLLLGRVQVQTGKRPRMAHPDLVRDEPGAGIRARYPGLGIPPGTLRRAVTDAIARTSPLPDPVPATIVAREGMPEAEPLLRAVHGATFEVPPAEARKALAERLAWVEAFTRVWQRQLSEAQWGGARAPALPADLEGRRRFVEALGFPLTNAQRRAIESVARDLDSALPMRRLLMGDVGTGKTAVALAAAAQCVAAGFQCALLVPTGMLADQYLDAAAPLVKATGARITRLAAGMRAAERRTALAAVASGEAQIVVGTHAVLQDDVEFARLGLVVVDEQQRLGVAQRLMLVRKGQGMTRPHLLSLSATPIPRTLALALRGELATSILDERPRGRVPVATELVPRGDEARLIEALRDTCARGERVFFVSPRIEDDEELEAPGVVSRAEHLSRELAPAPVVVVHGAMPPALRARAMRAMRTGEAQVLVGTTVIEVGIDVPEATLMIVDGAERFGLAQLHQLRGRVGRGDRPGRCLLVHDELTDLARQRLETLARTTEGADVAKADLALRGSGDLGGTRQSGIVEDFSWLDPADPPPWVERIDADARALLERDPTLAAPEHHSLALAVRRMATVLAVREEAG